MSLIKRVWEERKELIKGIVIGVIIGAILVGGGIFGWEFTESDTFCTAFCHEVMGGYDLALQQGPHGSEHCVDCHGEECFIDKIKMKMFEDPVTFVKYVTKDYETPVHAHITNEFCERCHITPLKGNRQMSDVGFDHVIHTEVLDCETCHGRVAHGYEPMPTGHDLCGRCHQGEIRDTTECSMCHGTTVALN